MRTSKVGDDQAVRQISVFALILSSLKRWPILVLSLVVAFAIAGAYLVYTVPSYTATALIEITGDRGDAVAERKASEAYQAAEVVQTQIEAIRAPRVVNLLIEQLSRKEIDSLAPRRNSLLKPIKYYLGMGRGPLSEAQEVTRIKQTIAEAISVSQIGLTAVIKVSYTAEDPTLAAKVSNDIAAIAVQEARGRAATVTADAVLPLSIEVQSLREELELQQEEARRFRQDNNLFGEGGSAALVQQLASLNKKLAEVRGTEAEMQSRIGMLNSALSDVSNAASPVLSSPTVQQLKDRRSNLAADLNSARTIFGDRHPQIKRLRSQLEEIDASLREETGVVVAAMRQNATASSDEQRRLLQLITELQNRIATAEGSELKASELDRRAQATAAVYSELLKRETMLERMQKADLFVAGIRIISAAEEPFEPSHPKSVLILTLAGTLALLFGLVLVIVTEQIVAVKRQAGHTDGPMPRRDLAPAGSVSRPRRSLREAIATAGE
ncbi:GumC family protein [Aurantimonas sp. DM33-3]|uniref:GumC family protein n=1 Tax=Aurantimonas sp. DM33-3 TaxID=2766955 RepID=UPI0016528222|nr:GumC family protein [Aurantimonas sp. DM33-3]MBC6715559.1 GumC family protein [Aurantimonas sp. DM33-3]